MPAYDYDLFTIGAGSGGVRASRIAASYGARVAVAEERYLGGTCVNAGCVPKKLLFYAAHFHEAFQDAAGFGWQAGEHSFDWTQLIANKNTEISRLNKIYGKLLEEAGVELIEGVARIVDAHTVAVGRRKFTARHILIATGSWPVIPDFPGREHAITSNEVFFLEKLPQRVIVVGGGYIAVEFAGILRGLGARVTQLYRGPLFLRGFDDDIRHTLADEMVKKGIELQFNTNICAITKQADGALRAELTDGVDLGADIILFATGRAPKTKGLGLEKAGVKLNEKSAVIVNENYRSNVPSIHAVGDATDRVNLTPVAIAEGHALAGNLFGGKSRTLDYSNIPTCIFSQPNAATVGLTETEARQRYGRVDIYRSSFRPMKHTLSGRDERSMMKLIVDRDSDRVIGVHMVGPDAGEIIQGMAIAMKCGATKAQFDATIGIHPTAAEEFVTMRTPLPEPVADHDAVEEVPA